VAPPHFMYDCEAQLDGFLCPLYDAASPGRVTYPITTFKLSCSRFYRERCIHSAVVDKAEKEIA
jgi:hypothetical protein